MENLNVLIGKRIAEQRKKLKISQTDFAKTLDKSLRTIQKYESGDIDISISVLQQISEILNIPMNYLMGYDSSHIKVETLSDMFAYIFELENKKEITFDIEITKGDEGKRKSAVVFDSGEAENNAEIFNFLEKLKNNREAVETYWMDYQAFDAWKESVISYYSKTFLSGKERLILDETMRIQKRNELDQERLKKLMEQQNNNNGGNEQ